MASDLLAALLSPYRSAAAGEEMDMEFDPIYQLLNPVERATKQAGQTAGDAIRFTGDIPQLIKQMARKRYGWEGEDIRDLMALVQQESGFNPQADNPTSSAYGLFQFLQSTRDNYGLSLNAGPRAQTKAGLAYIADRYKSPSAAWDFHQGHNWY